MINLPQSWLCVNGEQESAFSKIKTFISKAPVLSYFHTAFETKIVADASKHGLGAVLLKKTAENSVFRPVGFASRSLSDAETTYSQTEREASAIVYSCERFKNYVYGLRFTVVTDHKSLPKLYSPSCLEPSMVLKTPRIWIWTRIRAGNEQYCYFIEKVILSLFLIHLK